MTWPNAITLSRLVFLGLIIFLLYEDWVGAATLNFLLALVAAISDWLDGYIARKYDMTTNLGKLMDAFIDKVLVLVLFVFLLDPCVALLPAWTIWLVLATALRDGVITGMRVLAARRGVVLGADRWGKRKTIWQMTSICVLLFKPLVTRDLARMLPWRHWDLIADWIWWNGILYFLLASLLTVFSGILYMHQYVPLLRRNSSAA